MFFKMNCYDLNDWPYLKHVSKTKIADALVGNDLRKQGTNPLDEFGLEFK